MADAKQAKRVNERLTSYWLLLQSNGKIPSEDSVDPNAIPDTWPDCFLIDLRDVNQDIQDYKYTYLGTALIDAFGEDLTDHSVSNTLIDPASHSMASYLQEMLETSAPVEMDAQFTNVFGQQIKYRGCIVPLTHASGDGIAYALGAMKWKAY